LAASVPLRAMLLTLTLLAVPTFLLAKLALV
jgi:hypothetical protein